MFISPVRNVICWECVLPRHTLVEDDEAEQEPRRCWKVDVNRSGSSCRIQQAPWRFNIWSLLGCRMSVTRILPDIIDDNVNNEAGLTPNLQAIKSIDRAKSHYLMSKLKPERKTWNIWVG